VRALGYRNLCCVLVGTVVVDLLLLFLALCCLEVVLCSFIHIARWRIDAVYSGAKRRKTGQGEGEGEGEERFSLRSEEAMRGLWSQTLDHSGTVKLSPPPPPPPPSQLRHRAARTCNPQGQSSGRVTPTCTPPRTDCKGLQATQPCPKERSMSGTLPSCLGFHRKSCSCQAGAAARRRGRHSQRARQPPTSRGSQTNPRARQPRNRATAQARTLARTAAQNLGHGKPKSTIRQLKLSVSRHAAPVCQPFSRVRHLVPRNKWCPFSRPRASRARHLASAQHGKVSPRSCDSRLAAQRRTTQADLLLNDA